MPIVVHSNGAEWHWTAITHEQVAATSSPGQPTSDMLGNFEDLLALIDQLRAPMSLIELGKPLPDDKFIPKPRIGPCGAAHNRAPLDTDD